MFLHKYKDDSGTFYGLTGSNNANNVKLLQKTASTISADRVKNALALIEAAFREKPEPEKKELEKKEPEKKKVAVSDIIRKYAQMLSSVN